MLHAFAQTEAVRLEACDFVTGEVEEIEWRWDALQTELPLLCRGVAASYKVFADADGERGVRRLRMRWGAMSSCRGCWLRGMNRNEVRIGWVFALVQFVFLSSFACN
jgi:hypothetical protein